MSRNRFNRPAKARDFFLSGKATVTLVGAKSAITFRIQRAPDRAGRRPWFVKVKRGSGFEYIGLIPETRPGVADFWLRNSKEASEADRAAVNSFQWVWGRIAEATEDDVSLPDGVEIWHEGSCGMCGRPLTDPESIASGYGPICRERL